MCSEASGDREPSGRASSLSWVTKVAWLGQSVLGARITSLVPVLLNNGVGRVHHGPGMVLSIVCVCVRAHVCVHVYTCACEPQSGSS